MTESRPRRSPTPQEQARLEAMKRNWEQRRQVGERLSNVKTKIGVYSGKGGVGKTTVAVNLAVTLAHRGFSVGLLDVDIDCPNVHSLIAAHEDPRHSEDGLIPAQAWGVKVMSMGYLQQDPNEAIIMRGPMIHNTINQLLQSTNWGELDYLVVDLPPGTSDAPLTIMQVLQMDGFLVVTSPQALALLDAKRSINMIRKMNVNVTGVVENFSGDIFGRGAGEQLSKEMSLEFLGHIELRPDYQNTDRPTVLVSEIVKDEYEKILDGVLKQLKIADSK